jgi:hypothetical protein
MVREIDRRKQSMIDRMQQSDEIIAILRCDAA